MSEGADRHVASNLPPGWCVIELGGAGEIVTGNTPPTADKDNFGDAFPLVRPTELGTDRPIIEAAVGLSNQGANLARLLPTGSVLVSCIGALGKVGIAGCELATNQQINSVIFYSELVDAHYGFYYLQTIRKWLEDHSSATTISIINKSKFQRAPFILAPLTTQTRIVAEIEKQFTRLDAATAALKRVQANLKRYRASVLKAACEGRLVSTEAELARKEGRDYETGDKLLQRILRERRARWEADTLSKMTTGSKRPADDRWKDRYVEPSAPDTTNLPKLPEGWTWASWEQLSQRVTVGHVGPMKHRYVQSGIPFLRSQNVRANRYDPEGLLFIPREFHDELQKSKLQAGDLLVVRSGSVGTTCVLPSHIGEANCADLVIVQRPALLADLGAYYMNSLAQKLIAEGKVGVALIHFNTASVASLPVPVPPAPEQERIAAECAKRLSIIDSTEAAILAKVRSASNLRQSVLSSAFQGKLVQQDPADEPATVALERIRAERRVDASARPRRGAKGVLHA